MGWKLLLRTLLALAILEHLEGSERGTAGENLVAQFGLVVTVLYLLVRIVRFTWEDSVSPCKQCKIN
jgi:hypothetical protein